MSKELTVRETEILIDVKDQAVRDIATAAIEKGIPIDGRGVPQADPNAIRNFNQGDFVSFDLKGKKVTGMMLGWVEGRAVVTVDGQDYQVDAALLGEGAEGL